MKKKRYTKPKTRFISDLVSLQLMAGSPTNPNFSYNPDSEKDGGVFSDSNSIGEGGRGEF